MCVGMEKSLVLIYIFSNSVFHDDQLEKILLYAPPSPGKQSKTTVSTLTTREILIPSSKRLFLLANKNSCKVWSYQTD